ncbi:MAG: 3-phosphoglycerate dehydrogenase [Bacilli bacterium]|jgi:D-3-phosphoglycerate dehydrogenase
MKNIICLNNISPIGLKALPKDYEIVTDIAGADAVLVRSANMLEMSLPKRVVAVARAGAGVNNIPLEPYAKVGVVVFNTPGANANAVKELTIAGMLLAARDIHGGMKWVEANKADSEINKNMEKAKAGFAGTEILGKTIGIFGLGAVGSLIANAAGGLGMHVVGFEPSSATIERNKKLFPKDIELVKSADELYAKADYISLNVPLLPATKGMINKESISKMKDGVIILNIARDAIVNDVDMKVALEARKVRTYVTDFPNFASANMSHVVAIPHLGASTEEAEDNCAKMAAEEISEYIERGNISNSVNYPSLSLGALKAHRLVVLYENIEGLAQSLSSEVSKVAKVANMLSGVKGTFAASLFDIDKAIDTAKLAGLKGVIKVRLI